MGISKEKTFITFASIAVTGPVLGVIAGGYAFTYIGGYGDPKALPIAILFISVGGVAAMLGCFLNHFYLCAFLWWLQFFTGGFALPVLVGIMLNLVPPSMKTLANSIANLMYNLVGYFPSPFIYGIVYEMSGGGKSRWGMFALQCGGISASGFLIFAYLTRQAG
jgi:hypothetical protein